MPVTKVTKKQPLDLKPIKVEHAELMFDGLCDSRLYTFIPEDPPSSLHELEKRYKFLQTSKSPNDNEIWLNWIVFKHDSQIPVGYVQSTVRLGEGSLIAYAIFPEFWKKGFATEAVSQAIKWVFDRYDTLAIEAFVDTRNIASQQLALKLGFSCEEEIKAADYFKGKSSDEYRYVLSRSTWSELN